MTFHKYFIQHRKTIYSLFRYGIVPFSVINHFSIYNYYLDCLDVNMSKKEAIEDTMNYFKVKQRTVYNIITKFST